MPLPVPVVRMRLLLLVTNYIPLRQRNKGKCLLNLQRALDNYPGRAAYPVSETPSTRTTLARLAQSGFTITTGFPSTLSTRDVHQSQFAVKLLYFVSGDNSAPTSAGRL